MKQTFRQYFKRCCGEYRRCVHPFPLTSTPANSAINLAAGEGITWGWAWKSFNALKSIYGTTEAWRDPAGDGDYCALS